MVGPVCQARVHRLDMLYREIHVHAAARDAGSPRLIRRRVHPRSLEGELLLLGQGLAKETQRLTGYPYRLPTGLSRGGRRLDGFLSSFRYTIDHTDVTRRYAYSTDLVPWFPGRTKDGRHDLQPSEEEIASCWSWFEREVELVEPSIVILLGFSAAHAFLNRYACMNIRPNKSTLADVVGRAFDVEVRACPVTAVAIYHPSAAWGALHDRADLALQSAQRIIRRGLPLPHDDRKFSPSPSPSEFLARPPKKPC